MRKEEFLRQLEYLLHSMLSFIQPEQGHDMDTKAGSGVAPIALSDRSFGRAGAKRLPPAPETCCLFCLLRTARQRTGLHSARLMANEKLLRRRQLLKKLRDILVQIVPCDDDRVIFRQFSENRCEDLHRRG